MGGQNTQRIGCGERRMEAIEQKMTGVLLRAHITVAGYGWENAASL